MDRTRRSPDGASTKAHASTPDEFRRTLLRGLLRDAQEGRGTDLEVIVPTQTGKKDKEGTKNDTVFFHLHHSIVAATSCYFATFPEPKIGRVVDDVDSESFSICVEFMYTGENREALTHDNVSSVLHASELLQIEGLKEICMAYLEHNLEHGNHQQVVELADRFNNPALRKRALRFESENASRDELESRKKTLFNKIQLIKYDKNRVIKREKVANTQLEETESRLKEIFLRQHEQLLLSKKEPSQDSTKLSDNTAEMPGTVGHLVQAQHPSKAYRGTSTYGYECESNSSECYPLPPPPTEKVFKKYGIVHSHASVATAIEAANPGDRIYLARGNHVLQDDENFVDKALEFIGLDDPRNVILWIGYDSYTVNTGPVGFCNITFLEKRPEMGPTPAYAPDHAHGSGDDAIILFDACNAADLAIKNCIFDMGTECHTAYQTRVSGIFLKKGRSATVEGCQFLGGAGSAIVAVNDPYLNIPSIKVIQNSFVGNGQPCFSEISKNRVHKSSQKDEDFDFSPIPSHEITPGPASVELWMFNRKYYISPRGKLEKHEKVNVNVTNNTFAHNLRAPLVYREVFAEPAETGIYSAPGRSSHDAKVTNMNTWQLHSDLPAGEDLNELVPTFNLLLTDNVFEDNGIQYDKKILCVMRGSSNRGDKRTHSGDNNLSDKSSFPDGDSLLVVQHYITEFDEDSFPPGWAQGLPKEGYDREMCEVGDYIGEDSDLSGGEDSELAGDY